MNQYWFEHDWSSTETLDRRSGSNRLRRIAKESQEQDEGQIKTWLDLAKKLFDDDDRNPEAA